MLRSRCIKYDLLVILGAHSLEVVNTVKTLAVCFNEHMSWNNEIASIVNKTSKVTDVLNRLHRFLSQGIKLLVYNALFHSQLGYSFLVWGTSMQLNINKLLLQKKCCQITVNSPFYMQMTPLKSLNILLVSQLLKFSLINKYKTGMKQNNYMLNKIRRKKWIEFIVPAAFIFVMFLLVERVYGNNC